jgi:hypothetical protein
MPEIAAFKSGKDLVPEARIDDSETVTCIDCGAEESDEKAYQNGWQLVPSVCPNCLRWVVIADVDETCCFGRRK